ncbi:E3 ubiquitin protein ligase [Thalictrum thalictroides]|uniref:E3 ubiquitin protein ligase n=1 Tax=Thalictrum thalictroides TaxID=46969 RepID=A0A7J6VTV5_THATH|nr:E3 ubiquitin protein ligase [Thalictrum thalictroides]
MVYFILFLSSEFAIFVGCGWISTRAYLIDVLNRNEIKFLEPLVEKSQKESKELQIFLEINVQKRFNNRDVVEIKESEHRALSQAEVLRNALELRRA